MGPGILAAIPYEPLLRDRDSEPRRADAHGDDPQHHQPAGEIPPKHLPALSTLRRYAEALGCEVAIHLTLR